MRTDHHVLEQRHAGEQRQVLEGAGDAVAGDAVRRHAEQVVALEEHPALGRLIDPADDVEHRRLARAVRTDEATDLAFVDGEAEAVECCDPPESHRHALCIKQTHVGSQPVDVSIGTR